MKSRNKKHYKKNNAGKMVAGMLIGGVVGATVGWLTAPTPGAETRRRLTGELKSHREKIRTSVGNVESRSRELLEEVSDQAEGMRS